MVKTDESCYSFEIAYLYPFFKYYCLTIFKLNLEHSLKRVDNTVWELNTRVRNLGFVISPFHNETPTASFKHVRIDLMLTHHSELVILHNVSIYGSVI